MARVIRQTVRAWVVALVALVAAAAGMSALTAGSSTTSQVRIAFAAAVLSAYAAAAALVATDRSERTVPRCLLWGPAVPTLVGLANVALVTAAADAARGVVSGLPWVLAALLVSALGPRLPSLRFPACLRRR